MSERLRVLILSAPEAGHHLERLKPSLEEGFPHDILYDHQLVGNGDSTWQESILGAVKQFRADVLILVMGTALAEPGVLDGISDCASRIPTLALVSPEHPHHVVSLLRAGVSGFVTPSLCDSGILPRVLHLSKAFDSEKKPPVARLRRLIGEDPAFLYEVQKIPFVAASDSSVLILGETGTGKELFARAIHEQSPRFSKPFIAINCGAIPTELAESEFFGHQKGAFTGAITSKAGLIAAANKGSLFLDEVHSLPALLQTKLLRFLESKEYRPVGSSKLHQVKVRVISAANTELQKELDEGRFRRDLYYRLNVLPFVLPPLRQRQGDIPLLASHFLKSRCREQGIEPRRLSSDAVQKLMEHHWPGNIRELFNVLERSLVMTRRESLGASDIALPQEEGGARAAADTFQAAKAKAVRQFEVEYIERLLQVYRGNISHAAHAARKHRRAFWELIRKHRIDVERFKIVN